MLEQLLMLLGVISGNFDQPGFNSREMICVLYLHKILSSQSQILYNNLYAFLSAAYTCESTEDGVLLIKSILVTRCADLSQFTGNI